MRTVVRGHDVGLEVLVNDLRSGKNDVDTRAEKGLNQLQRNDQGWVGCFPFHGSSEQFVQFVSRRTRRGTKRREKTIARRIVMQTGEIL